MSDAHTGPQSDPVASIARLKADAEAAYYKMYHAHTTADINSQFQYAEDLLVEASQLSGELGMEEEAQSIRARYQHFRDAFRAQFRRPI
jgi:hypothetical protein